MHFLYYRKCKLTHFFALKVQIHAFFWPKKDQILRILRGSLGVSNSITRQFEAFSSHGEDYRGSGSVVVMQVQADWKCEDESICC